ncbi:pyridoxamine 5'-phosphate oxidase family protein [Blastococcus sp. SYSU DS0533]
MPGSNGEHHLQERYGTSTRARAFYDHQVLEHLSERMQTFIQRMDMVFIATADGSGDADCSFRSGGPGFVGVLDERTLLYPEYRGNGVMSSLGNIAETRGIGMLFIDFCGDAIGLHVNGRAAILENEQLLSAGPLPEQVVDGLLQQGGRRPDRWVRVSVTEAYIHCSKHIPRLVRQSQSSQAVETEDAARTCGDYFEAKHLPRPWTAPAPAPGTVVPRAGGDQPVVQRM